MKGFLRFELKLFEEVRWRFVISNVYVFNSFILFLFENDRNEKISVVSRIPSEDLFLYTHLFTTWWLDRSLPNRITVASDFFNGISINPVTAIFDNQGDSFPSFDILLNPLKKIGIMNRFTNGFCLNSPFLDTYLIVWFL